MNLEAYGFLPDEMPVDAQGIPARITAVHKERYALVCQYAETYGRLKAAEYFAGSQEFPTTGDFVLINFNPGGDSQIIRTLPRRTFFSRKNPTLGRGEQAVAANFDYVFIMQSLNQNFNVKRLERYLTLAWQSGAAPVIVLTKPDLAKDYGGYLKAARDVAKGVPVHAVSSRTGEGMESLAHYTKPGKTLVLLGSSGVGKSSLVNALAGEEVMAVNGIRNEDARGRHTTTHRQLILLKCKAMLIDTPGMRELGMWNVSGGLDEAFSDVEQFLGHCRFGNCRHQSEPGCAIRQAIESGELRLERWNSYQKLKKEAQYEENRAAAMRQKWQRNKTLAKRRRQI